MIRKLLTATAVVTTVLLLTGCSAMLGAFYTDGEIDTASGGSTTDAVDTEAIDEEVADAIDVVDYFWSTHFDDFYVGGDRYTPPADFIPYVASDLPTCGGEPVEADNAFYCYPDNTILWDQNLMDAAYAQGDSVVYLIIAHEWGHAIQSQISDDSLWTAEELQADCFAAAALYGAADDEYFAWEPGDTAEITNALTDLADETNWTDIEDHGDPLDRIDAFNDGRTMGVEGCYPVEE